MMNDTGSEFDSVQNIVVKVLMEVCQDVVISCSICEMEVITKLGDFTR